MSTVLDFSDHLRAIVHDPYQNPSPGVQGQPWSIGPCTGLDGVALLGPLMAMFLTCEWSVSR